MAKDIRYLFKVLVDDVVEVVKPGKYLEAEFDRTR